MSVYIFWKDIFLLENWSIIFVDNFDCWRCSGLVMEMSRYFWYLWVEFRDVSRYFIVF